MLDIMEERLLEMKLLVEQAKQENLKSEVMETLKANLKILAEKFSAIDSESGKTKEETILEWASLAGVIAAGAFYQVR